MSTRVVALLALLSVVALSACQARIADPIGDSLNPDIVAAGIDYGSGSTTLWIRYEPGHAAADYREWAVSVNGDREPDFFVKHGVPPGLTGDPMRYEVQSVANSGEVRCAGYQRADALRRPNLESLRIDSACLRTGDTAPLPADLRISAYAVSGPHTSGDSTAWTPAAPRS